MVELTHFNLLRSVGKGAFGKVRVVQHKGTQKIYALKYINKAKCIQMRAVENIIQERKLLEEVHHPFIWYVYYFVVVGDVEFGIDTHFLDDENLFMVIDLMLGGDLRFHLDRMGTFKEEMVKFYTAQICLGLAYLHSKKIVHRDLKPDNILLDEFGHASLTDFNIAVHYKEDKPLTAVAGSMAYMAPEVLAKKGYFSAVDWWSLGVVAYELLFGKRPFRSKTNDGLTNSIINDPLSFPSEPATVSADAKDCVKAFISRHLDNRLGAKESGGMQRIKEHPWFKEYDWEKLEAKDLPPPFVPDSKKANFDATHELEELLLEDNPLKAKPRKKNAEGKLEPRVAPAGEAPEVTKMMNMMEEKFIVFDYTRPKAKSSAVRLPPMDASLRNGVNGDGTAAAADAAGAVKVDGEEEIEMSYHDPMEGRSDAMNAKGMTDTTVSTPTGGRRRRGLSDKQGKEE
ncbi:hypothetical protein HK101_009139 [Irineochytrium annulatum]|nr:hypothetical protein HK101_009139 [Irineochytrium annulatum]